MKSTVRALFLIGVWSLANVMPSPGLAETLLTGDQSKSKAVQTKPLSNQGGPYLMGDQVRENVSKTVSDINWSNNLGQCEWEAQHSHKLVFWMHMLGSINGFT
jgi:hypothetical protein